MDTTHVTEEMVVDFGQGKRVLSSAENPHQLRSPTVLLVNAYRRHLSILVSRPEYESEKFTCHLLFRLKLCGNILSFHESVHIFCTLMGLSTWDIDGDFKRED